MSRYSRLKWGTPLFLAQHETEHKDERIIDSRDRTKVPEYSTNIDPNPRSQGHFTRGTVPHQSQLPLLGDRAGDSKAENTAGIAR